MWRLVPKCLITQLMQPMLKWNFSKAFGLVICVFFLGGCSLLQPPTTNAAKIIRSTSRQKVFYYNYDLVWRAAQLSLRYPMSINNMDNGVLETEYISLVDGFISPIEESPKTSGVRYKINLILARGKVEGRDSVRVTVNKYIEKKSDFFSETSQLESDGLEENVILYRIERELIIEEALKKAARGS